MKFIFATVFHEYPASARQLVAGTLRHYPSSDYLYLVDRAAGWRRGLCDEARRLASEGRAYRVRYPFSFLLPRGRGPVRLVRGNRRYSWKNLHRYLFDVVWALSSRGDYDYLVLLDSDAAITGPGLEAMLISAGRPDFSVTSDDPDQYGSWVHGATFLDRWERYAALARALDLAPRLRGLGTMFGMVILSQRVVQRLNALIPALEASPDYRSFEEGDDRFPSYEALIPQLLGDLGFRHFNVRDYCPGYRVRPFWGPEEYDPALWFYHPVNRYPADPFRRLLAGKRAQLS